MDFSNGDADTQTFLDFSLEATNLMLQKKV